MLHPAYKHILPKEYFQALVQQNNKSLCTKGVSTYPGLSLRRCGGMGMNMMRKEEEHSNNNEDDEEEKGEDKDKK